MKAKQLALQIELMAAEAAKHTAAAEYLRSSADGHSDSAYLLQLLAFEILLKATLRMNERPVPRSHAYCELFASLPPALRARLRDNASTRMAGTADYSDLNSLLFTWSRNFVEWRYPYAKYEGQTAEQYHDRGSEWVDKGAPEAEADFVSYAEQLFGMVFALDQEVQSWLAAQAP